MSTFFPTFWRLGHTLHVASSGLELMTILQPPKYRGYGSGATMPSPSFLFLECVLRGKPVNPELLALFPLEWRDGILQCQVGRSGLQAGKSSVSELGRTLGPLLLPAVELACCTGLAHFCSWLHKDHRSHTHRVSFPVGVVPNSLHIFPSS